MRKTLYDILEVSASASAETIAASHQRLRNDLQPKVDAGDQDARMHLVAVREAYQTLSDPARRRQYDALQSTLTPPASPSADAADSPSDDWREEFRMSGPVVAKGVMVLGAVLLAGYAYISYRDAEVERVERMRVMEARKLTLEREKLAIERAKVEAAAAEQERRVALEKLRLEEVARQRTSNEELARARAVADRAHAADIEKANQMQFDRLRQIQEQAARDGERDAVARRQNEAASREKQLLRNICMQRYGRPDC